MDHQRADVRAYLTACGQITLTDSYSDGPTPEKQCEQILAIYPILKGQKRDSRHSIPPRGSASGQGSHQLPAGHHPTDQHPTQERPAEPSAADQGGDLIDFGQNDPQPPALKQPEVKPESKVELKAEPKLEPEPEPMLEQDPTADPKPGPDPENRPVIDAYHQSTAKIQSMLSQTGSPAPGGPLIDFHQDMKTTLPAGIKRADTAESSDEFVDAHE